LQHQRKTLDVPALLTPFGRGYDLCYLCSGSGPTGSSDRVLILLSRLKELVAVKFSEWVEPDAADSKDTGVKRPIGAYVLSRGVSIRWCDIGILDAGHRQHMCPSCRKALSKVTKIGVLRRCGHVLCMQCIDTLVKKDLACSHCGDMCALRDIIPLKTGGASVLVTLLCMLCRSDTCS